jgi:hypothetical protein
MSGTDEADQRTAELFGTRVVEAFRRYNQARTADRALGRQADEQQRAERLAEMELRVNRLSSELGRPPRYRYRGGPVDWETGLPAGSACAWLRRTRIARDKETAA